MSVYLSVDIDRCRDRGHHLETAWSDKSPLKVNIICTTCTDANPGKTAYGAYGDDLKSWGPWRKHTREPIAEEHHAIPED